MQQPKRFQTTITQDPLTQKRRLIFEIEEQKKALIKTDQKLSLYKKEHQKMLESNARNVKRLIKIRNRQEDLIKHRNQPEYFLHLSGFMSEYMQEFLLTHDVAIMNVDHGPNPDNMSYEQLLELGESIGKVSKGISKQQFQSLDRKKNISQDHNCPICCTQFTVGETAVALPCRHMYHEECILEWLKDENTCPICKKHVLEK